MLVNSSKKNQKSLFRTRLCREVWCKCSRKIKCAAHLEERRWSQTTIRWSVEKKMGCKTRDNLQRQGIKSSFTSIGHKTKLKRNKSTTSVYSFRIECQKWITQSRELNLKFVSNKVWSAETKMVNNRYKLKKRLAVTISTKESRQWRKQATWEILVADHKMAVPIRFQRRSIQCSWDPKGLMILLIGGTRNRSLSVFRCKISWDK